MTAAPIFIVGCPRSGTTLLRNLLRSHPRITFPSESHFIPSFYRGYGNPGSDGEAVELARRILRVEWIRQWGIRITPEEFAGDRSFRAVVGRLFECWARADGKPRWGDKTPHYVQEIATLAELFPEARVIHMLRDGRDVELSWLKAGFEPRNLYTAALLWKRYVTAGRTAGARLPAASYRELRYEALVNQPERVMREVCDFLGEPFSETVLQPTPIRQVLRPAFLGRGNRDVPSSPELLRPSVAGWKSSFSREDRILFESVAGDLLSTLGYETDGVTRPVSALERFGWGLHHRFWWFMERVNLKGSHRWLRTELEIRRARARAGRSGAGGGH